MEVSELLDAIEGGAIALSISLAWKSHKISRLKNKRAQKILNPKICEKSGLEL